MKKIFKKYILLIFLGLPQFVIADVKLPKLKHDQAGAILICESAKRLIRIDNANADSDEKVRYRSFKLGHENGKPEIDLIGSAQYEGSAHNAIYTFKNGEYTYEVEAANVCGDEDFDKSIDRCMPWLTVKHGSKVVIEGRCHP